MICCYAPQLGSIESQMRKSQKNSGSSYSCRQTNQNFMLSNLYNPRGWLLSYIYLVKVVCFRVCQLFAKRYLPAYFRSLDFFIPQYLPRNYATEFIAQWEWIWEWAKDTGTNTTMKVGVNTDLLVGKQTDHYSKSMKVLRKKFSMNVKEREQKPSFQIASVTKQLFDTLSPRKLNITNSKNVRFVNTVKESLCNFFPYFNSSFLTSFWNWSINL